jgi:hypothetical protein
MGFISIAKPFAITIFAPFSSAQALLLRAG